MPNLRFKDISIHFTDHGKGPAVVLLHGFLENRSMWNEIARGLVKTHRVICVDLPGHGQSDCIGYVHSMDEMAEVVKAVIGELKIRRIDLFGHSMGGYVGLAFAEKYPDHVRLLALYQSTALADSPQKKEDRLRALELIRRNPDQFIRKAIPMLFRPVNRKRLKEAIGHLIEEARKTSHQGIVAAILGMRDRPNRELLLKFPPYPVHIIASDKDPRIPIEESKQLSEISEFVHLHVIKGSGHMSYLEDPDATLEIFKKALHSSS